MGSIIDDWQLLVIILGILGLVALFKLLRWETRQSRLEGQLESTRKDINLLRDENESLRVRLKELEIEYKKEHYGKLNQ